jgi:hypothetical protein
MFPITLILTYFPTNQSLQLHVYLVNSILIHAFHNFYPLSTIDQNNFNPINGPSSTKMSKSHAKHQNFENQTWDSYK